MSMNRYLLWISLCVWVGAACGDNDGDDPYTGKVTNEDLTSMCMDLCRYDVRCSGDSLDACTDQCVFFSEWVRGDLFGVFSACVKDADCGERDTCPGATGEAPGLPIHDEFARACAERFNSCGLIGDRYCDDGDITAVNSDLMAELLGCFERECADVVSCLESTAASQNYTF